MIERKKYLQKLIAFRDKAVVKVITGMRRCGKSVLLSQYAEYLLSCGVKKENVLLINFELLENESLKDYHKLYEYVLSRLPSSESLYLMIDEVQEVPAFERAIDSLLARGGVDITLTGSNSKMLSTELSTLLSGRYVEIGMLPFSFKEYLELKGGNPDQAFADFYRFGGMPYVAALDEPNLKKVYLEGIYHTVLIKDLIERKKIGDVELFKDVLRFLLESIGNRVSAQKIANTAVSFGRKTNHVTIGNYIEMILESYIMYKVYRYDVRGKARLQTLEKYYTVDLGFRSLLLGDSNLDLGSALENIVFLELLRRDFKVYTGKTGEKEIDFVAIKGDQKFYVQVSASILDETTRERELAPLLSVKDNYTKIILTLDRLPMQWDGIKQINLIDWLLNE